jgi:uncharacterized DUF497 family protein
MRFEWDPQKAHSNLAKHGASFNEAATVFGDTLGWTYPDEHHSGVEERWLTMGMSEQRRILVVAHTIEEGGQRIRIFSAREATRKERSFYEEG